MGDQQAYHSHPIILRSVFHGKDSTTAMEVSANTVYLSHEGFRALRPVPLDPESEGYNAVSEEVREHMARKLSRLLPSLPEGKREEVRDHVFKTLEVIARDQLPRVRSAMAEEMKEMTDVPRDVIRTLAWDDDIGVCSPILEYSTLLSDEDLLDLIASTPVPGVLEAIARRKKVSVSLSTAIVKRDSEPAITALLNNKGAEFSAEVLDGLHSRAVHVEAWKAAFAERPELAQRTVNRVASLVASAVANELEAAGKVSDETRQEAALAVKARLQTPSVDREKNAKQRAKDLFDHEKLDEEHILAAIESSEREFITHALALKSKLSLDIVKRILNTQNPRAVTALAWKCGLSMRCAMQLQIKVVKIHHTRLLYAKGGTDYPHPPKVWKEYLAHFMGEPPPTVLGPRGKASR